MDVKVEAVHKMQEYIKEYLASPISLADLAKVAQFSPWYAARIFKELTGFSPAEYIRKSRLSNSALRLRDERVKVIDIAYEMNFDSVDGYQRAFHKEFGCNPKEYSKNPIPIGLFTQYDVKHKKMWKEHSEMETVKNVFIQIIEKPARKVIIKRGHQAEDYMQYCKEVGCDVWGILTSIKSFSAEPVCLWLPQQYRKPNTSTYVQGVEVDINDNSSIPEGFDVIELPAAKYLMFQGESFLEEDYCEAINIVQKAIDKYDPSMIGYEWNYDSPRIQLEPIGKKGYIELKAIK